MSTPAGFNSWNGNYLNVVRQTYLLIVFTRSYFGDICIIFFEILVFEKLAVVDIILQGHSRSSDITGFDRHHRVHINLSGNCGFILHRLRNTTTYWSKISHFMPHPCLTPSPLRVAPSEFQNAIQLASYLASSAMCLFGAVSRGPCTSAEPLSIYDERDDRRSVRRHVTGRCVVDDN